MTERSFTSTQTDTAPFWKRLSLTELSPEQWEALCDGCGKCCLEKLEDEETGEISYTDIACRLLDVQSCKCTRYKKRRKYVKNCERLTPESVPHLRWLPLSCAYRLLAAGQDLPWWHHLVSGDRDLVHRVGASASGRAVPPSRSQSLEHHIVTWPASTEIERP